MKLPEVPPFKVENVPEELKRRRQWICWRYDMRDGKIIKVPIAPWMGHNGPVSVTDPNNCTDFNVAVDYAGRLGLGIGFVFFKGAGIVGVDLDKLDQLGGEAQDYIKKANSYCEYSPSGRGVHIYGYGELKRAIKKAGMEVYNDARFFTVTGNNVEGTASTLGDIQPLLDELVSKYGERETLTAEAKFAPGGGWETYVNKLGYTLEEVRQKDKVLDEYLRGGLAGKPSDSEADMGTLERLLFWGFEPDEAVAVLQHYRWRKKLLRNDYIEGMLRKLLPLRGTAKPKQPKPVEMSPCASEEFNKPLTVDELIYILGTTVKRDDFNKAITFLVMLLTYTEEDQTNLGYLAESSAGKSYIPLELSWYFPREDVIKLGYASPTAFFHEFGEVVTDPATKRKVIHINLSRKILIFLDQPHDQLLQRLRSFLSHDEKQIMFKITDKREKAGLRTKTVVIHGFPTVIFCTAKLGLKEQEKTRLLLLSPEVSQEKLRESIALRIERESDRDGFLQRMLEDPDRGLLTARVLSLKRANIRHVKIPEELRALIYEKFLEEHKFLIARHQRDISRLLAIIKGHALLNFMHRGKEVNGHGLSIIVNEDDVAEGFRLYKNVSEANELGLSPELFSVYQSMKPHFAQRKEVEVEVGRSTKTVTLEGITIREFQSIYANKFHKAIGYEESRRILKTLASVGLITETPDPTDRRQVRYTLLELGVTADESVGSTPPGGKKHNLSIPPTGKEYICEVCGGSASTVVVREDGEHWLCGRCLADWEGNL